MHEQLQLDYHQELIRPQVCWARWAWWMTK